ncbi:MAG: ATP-binding protein [Burkholderiales bacterium]|nr:ATP-binding protein [Burkholderiales bacterium]
MRLPEPRRLALLGGESSGKTTLAVALARRLGTVWVPEYGRRRWEELRRDLTPDELVAVAREQVRLEEEASDAAAADARDWIICDTTPLTTLQYCLHDHGRAPGELVELARRRYDRTVVCEPDFGFVQDGCRRSDLFRAEQHAWTVERLSEMGVDYLTVHGTPAQRLQAVLRHLGGGDNRPSPLGEAEPI